MPVLRFHLLTITHEQVNGSVTVTITTNAACHLYLRYSDIFPRIHRKSVLRRGLLMGWDARYCFTVYQHIEQDEPSDTWTHTFTWPGWENCNTRYFYFWGTMGGQDMVSDTPIFWIHYLEVPTEYGPPEIHRFYPDAHPELTSVDGWINKMGYRASWIFITTGIGYAAYPEAHWGWVNFTSSTLPDTWSTLDRTIFVFDTSTIPPLSLITSGSFNFFGKSKRDILASDPAVNLFQSYPNTNTQVVKEDFTPFGTVALATEILYADYIDNGMNLLTLNEAGLAAVVSGGITKLGLRESKYDATGIEPPWASPGYAGFEFWMSEKGDEFRPYLEVTYQPPL